MEGAARDCLLKLHGEMVSPPAGCLAPWTIVWKSAAWHVVILCVCVCVCAGAVQCGALCLQDSGRHLLAAASHLHRDLPGQRCDSPHTTNPHVGIS